MHYFVSMKLIAEVDSFLACSNPLKQNKSMQMKRDHVNDIFELLNYIHCIKPKITLFHISK